MAELPDHLAALTRFSLATGLRQANATGLRWDQIDMTRVVAWIHADQAKGGKAIPVPLNSELLAVVREQIGWNPTAVFSRSIDVRSCSPTPRRGERHWCAPASTISGGTTYGTHGPVGTSRPGLRCMSCKNWAVGKPRPWSAATRIWRQNTSPNIRPESYGLHQTCTTAS